MPNHFFANNNYLKVNVKREFSELTTISKSLVKLTAVTPCKKLMMCFLTKSSLVTQSL